MQVQDNRLSSLREYMQHSLRKSIYAPAELRSLFTLIAEDLLGLRPAQIMLARDTRLSESEILKGLGAIKALKQGRPIQYIIGHTEFMGMRIHTDERALIPRPETEELIYWIREKEDVPTRALDIGTGSGCIALALKQAYPHAAVHGLDVHREALSLAQENGRSLDLEVHWTEADILKPQKGLPHFDLIVSNPPYVLYSEQVSMRSNVLDHEPHSALFVTDEDPTLFYHHILGFAQEHLTPSGSLYFEINERYASDIAQRALDHGFGEVEVRQDIHGKDRMMRIRSIGP